VFDANGCERELQLADIVKSLPYLTFRLGWAGRIRIP